MGSKLEPFCYFYPGKLDIRTTESGTSITTKPERRETGLLRTMLCAVRAQTGGTDGWGERIEDNERRQENGDVHGAEARHI